MPDEKWPVRTWMNTAVDIRVDVYPERLADKVRLSLRPPDPVSPTYDGGDTIMPITSSPTYLTLYGSIKYGNEQPDSKSFEYDVRGDEDWRGVSGETEIEQWLMEHTLQPSIDKLLDRLFQPGIQSLIQGLVKDWADKAESDMRAQGKVTQANLFNQWRTTQGGDAYLKNRADTLFALVLGIPRSAWGLLDMDEVNKVDLTDRGNAVAFNDNKSSWDWGLLPKLRFPIGDLATEIDNHGLPGVLENPNLIWKGVDAKLKYTVDSSHWVDMQLDWTFNKQPWKFNDAKIKVLFRVNSKGRHSGTFSVGSTFEIETDNGSMKALLDAKMKF